MKGRCGDIGHWKVQGGVEVLLTTAIAAHWGKQGNY